MGAQCQLKFTLDEIKEMLVQHVQTKYNTTVSNITQSVSFKSQNDLIPMTNESYLIFNTYIIENNNDQTSSK